MGLLDKVKNFFYDDEEIEEEQEEVEVPVRVRRKEKKEMPKEEISERELFRAERTFNFPMNVDDDTIVVEEKPVVKEEIKQEEINEVEVKPYRSVNSYREVKQNENIYSGLRAYSKMERMPEVEVKKEEPKKFKPTPVISPIYGVLDKNYKKEDIIVNTDEDINIPKRVDYDSVRRRAYGNIYKTEVEEKEIPEEETKGIFYNLDEEVETKEELDNIDNDDEFNNSEEVKIIYNDVTFDEQDDSEISKEKTDEVEEEDIQNEDNIEIDEDSEDENILSETKEQDLFNLIDNMYNSDEEEEEEEE